MKLLTFSSNGDDRLGALVDEGVIDLSSADPSNPDLQSMQALIESGEAGMAAA